jgi:cytochrome c551/c552
MLSSDCKSCHKVDEPSIGPSYVQVAQRYQKDGKASTYLINKIIKGGAGAWGEVAMPAHPTMKEGDAKLIVSYVLSLAGDGSKQKSLPLVGQLNPAGGQTPKQNMLFTLSASYTDVGANGVRPLSGASMVYLRNPTVDLGNLRDVTGFTAKDSSGSKYLILPATEGSIKANSLDLTGIKSLEFIGFGSGEAGRYRIEVHTGSATGPMVGQGEMSFGADRQKTTATVPLQGTSNGGLQEVYIVCRPTQTGANNRPMLKWVRFVPGSDAAVALRR